MIGVAQRRHGPVERIALHAFFSQCQKHVDPENGADVVAPGFACRQLAKPPAKVAAIRVRDAISQRGDGRASTKRLATRPFGASVSAFSTSR